MRTLPTRLVPTIAIALALVLGLSQSAAANLVANPSFESPGHAGTTTRYTCTCAPPGFAWTVGGAGVDLVEGYWAAQDGAQSLDLNQDIQGPGTPPGAVSQLITTTAGLPYLVEFWMAANPDHSRSPDDGAPVKTMDVSFGTTSHSYSFDVSGHMHGDPGWVYRSFVATADAPGTLLSFVSTSTGYAGIIIDNVSVTPAPATPSRAATWGHVKALFR